MEVLQERRPKIICIDELDKMSRQFQNQLLNFMESGRIKVDQMRRQYDFEMAAKVFAACNEINSLSKPLQSRFTRLFLPSYTEEQFLNVSEKVLRSKIFATANDISSLLTPRTPSSILLLRLRYFFSNFIYCWFELTLKIFWSIKAQNICSRGVIL